MQHHRYSNAHDQKEQLADNENRQFLTTRSDYRMHSDTTSQQVAEVVIELPLDGNKTVQEPQIEMLQPMNADVSLMRRQTAEKSQLNVVIMPGDVGIGVVNHIVLASPVVGTAAQHIQRNGGQPIDDGVL